MQSFVVLLACKNIDRSTICMKRGKVSLRFEVNLKHKNDARFVFTSSCL